MLAKVTITFYSPAVVWVDGGGQRMLYRLLRLCLCVSVTAYGSACPIHSNVPSAYPDVST